MNHFDYVIDLTSRSTMRWTCNSTQHVLFERGAAGLGEICSRPLSRLAGTNYAHKGHSLPANDLIEVRSSADTPGYIPVSDQTMHLLHLRAAARLEKMYTNQAPDDLQSPYRYQNVGLDSLLVAMLPYLDNAHLLGQEKAKTSKKVPDFPVDEV